MDTMPLLSLTTWVDFFFINWFPVTILIIAGIGMQWVALGLSRKIAGAEEEHRPVFHRAYNLLGGVNAGLFTFLSLFALQSFSFSLSSLLTGLAVCLLVMCRILLADFFSGQLARLTRRAQKGDLAEVAGKLGIIGDIGIRSFALNKDGIQLRFPNRLLYMALFYNLRHEPVITVPFEIDVPRNLSLEEARKGIHAFFGTISFVLSVEEESVVKSIKPGAAWHIQLQVKTYGSQVWAVCEELHTDLGRALAELGNKETRRAYNWQIK